MAVSKYISFLLFFLLSPFAVGYSSSILDTLASFSPEIEAPPDFSKADLFESTAQQMHFNEVINGFYLWQADRYFSQNNTIQAKKAIDNVLAVSPDLAAAHAALGRYYFYVHDFQMSLKEFLLAQYLDPGYFPAYVDAADLYIKVFKRADLAIDSYKKALAIKPDHGQVHYALAVAYINDNQLDKAKLHFLQAAIIAPWYAQSWLAMGHIAMAEGNLSKAQQFLNKLLDYQPGFAPAYILLGDLFRKKQQYTKALSAYHQATSLQNNLSTAWMKIATLHEQLGADTQAINAYQKIVAIRPTEAEAYNNLAKLTLKKNQLAKAEEWARQAILLAPHKLIFRQTLAWIYQAQGKFQEALNLIKQFIGQEGDNAEMHYQLGVIYQKLEQAEKAKFFLKRAISINPNYNDARQVLRGL
ncbi:tetratricopeptide repeat protein [Endozoicomonas sp. SM1973]|uniref:Tetratricopeptide repeat protein n=1 Tax=Spartinivicinus marinus TaxID=2994442 RepID=A0A853IEE2_9GAMM|nr:tetratricopeptide repeat protein [Spartinivicinus marinus]MCX4028043.1 tetratricopeptide repeat protein [Spartinivicinus marinus]NYZ68331.1 tetratricopeptide repeat protein [Spartinivicinus marinus]